jgi:hypothetical protein
MRHRFIKISLILLLVLVITCPAIATELPRNVLIIDIPRLLYSDITRDYPTLNGLVDHAAAGIMTLPNLEPKTPEKIYLQ